jgi:hypothetical protein
MKEKSKYEQYKESYPNISDEEIINRIGNELSDKVQEIHKLLNVIELLKTDRVPLKTNDANSVFPEFDKDILGYYEIETEDKMIPIFCVCRLEQIIKSKIGEIPYYKENHDYISKLKYWWELPPVIPSVK